VNHAWLLAIGVIRPGAGSFGHRQRPAAALPFDLPRQACHTFYNALYFYSGDEAWRFPDIVGS
jgi:hypothetical protein